MPMALGHEAAGIVEELGAGVDDLRRATTSCWCSCRAAAIACRAPKAVPRCASRAPPRTPRARCSRGERRLFSATASPSTTTGLLGLRRIRDGVAPLAGQDRPRAAARRGRALRLRRAHRRGRRREHRAGARRRIHVAVIGLGGVGLASVLGARRRGRAAHRRRRPVRRQARARARSSAPRTRSTPRDPEVRRQGEGGDRGRRRLRDRDGGLGARASRPRTGSRAAAARRSPRACRRRPRPGRCRRRNLVAEERTIKGSYIGTCVPSRDLPRYIDLYRAGQARRSNKLMTRHDRSSTRSTRASTCCTKARRCGRWSSSRIEHAR